MEKSKFGESQIVAILKEGEAGCSAESCNAVSQAPVGSDHASRSRPASDTLVVVPALAAAYYEPVSDCSRRDAEVVGSAQRDRLPLRYGGVSTTVYGDRTKSDRMTARALRESIAHYVRIISAGFVVGQIFLPSL